MGRENWRAAKERYARYGRVRQVVWLLLILEGWTKLRPRYGYVKFVLCVLAFTELLGTGASRHA